MEGSSRLLALWRRFRVWVAKRAGLLRGQWQRFEVDAPVAGVSWWPLRMWRTSWDAALYRPAGLADEQDAPLVVLLHGCGQRAIEFAHASGFVRAADRGRFRLLCPEQRKGANAWRCWNWFMPQAQIGQGEQQVVLHALAAASAQVRCEVVAAVGLSAGGGLAALLAFHHAERFAAVITMAAPPLLGRANVQDPRQVMKAGLAISPGLATLLIPACAPLFVLHGAVDDVVSPRCAEQLVEQALHVRRRGAVAGALTMQALEGGAEHRIGERPVLRHLLLPGLGHAWSGAPGGHAHVVSEGPRLTALALDFMRDVGMPVGARPG
jgi:poly(hydroxyalkanoate) depolymerase family esterase